MLKATSRNNEQYLDVYLSCTHGTVLTEVLEL